MPSEQRVEFHAEALAELEHAKVWYERQQSGLGDSFFQEITAAISRISDTPKVWPQYAAGTRRVFLHRFPYAVIYHQRPQDILVVAVMHLKRQPGYWKARL